MLKAFCFIIRSYRAGELCEDMDGPLIAVVDLVTKQASKEV